MPETVFRLLGTVQPLYNEWRLFANSSVNAQIFRITFNAVDGQPINGSGLIKSSVLLRRKWFHTDKFLVSQARRFWPKDEQLLVDWPISADYQDKGFVVNEWECKLGWRWRYKGREELVIEVTLEEC